MPGGVLGIGANVHHDHVTVVEALIADAVSIEAAIWAVAALTALSGVVVIVRMYETLQPLSNDALVDTAPPLHR